MEFTQQQTTQQTLSTRMLQSVRILQMSAQELRQYVENLMLENPVLEHDETEPEREAEVYDSLQWEAANDVQNAQYYADDDDGRDPLANLGGGDGDADGLSTDLLLQFGGLRLEPEVLAAIRFLVERLDGDGRLEEDIAEQAEQEGIPAELFSRALTELQSADPAGVGARSLEECLRLQLARQAGDHRLAARIISDHLPDLARGRLSAIARACGVSSEEVQDACSRIRQLDPHPCARFASQERPRYLVPDVRLVARGEVFEAVPNTEASPRLQLSPYYQRLMRETGDREARDYLIQKTNQAKWVVNSIGQRQETLLRCARCVAERQAAFLRGRENALKTLTLREVAEQLGVHESTVSRAIREKYLQTPGGVYPFSFFFTHTVGQSETTPDTVKRLLRELIEAETEPLSDQALCEALRQQGCEISRRTVAKYRVELGIPSAQARKALR